MSFWRTGRSDNNSHDLENQHRNGPPPSEAIPQATLVSNGSFWDLGYSQVISSFQLTESPFRSWTRDELIMLVIHDNIQLYNEEDVTVDTLVEFCDSLYTGKPTPAKRPKYTQQEMAKIEHGALVLQNAWIYHKCKLKNLIARLQREDGATRNRGSIARPTINDTDFEFDFSNEILDFDDLQMLQGALQRTAQQDSMLESARQMHAILDTPWIPPDWVSARRSQDFVHPRKGGRGGSQFTMLTTTTGRHCVLGGFGEQCDLWGEGQVSEFSIYGPGVTNYFKFLKWLIWIAAGMCVLSIPLLMMNGSGGTSNSFGMQVTTVWNLQNYFTNGTSIVLPFCSVTLYGEVCQIDREKLGDSYMVIDFVLCIFVLAGFAWLKIFERTEEKNLNKNTVYTSMFTIAVKNFPPNTTALELVEHFNHALNHGFKIVDVDFAYDNAEEIQQCKRRGDLIKQKRQKVNHHRHDCTKIRQKFKDDYDAGEEQVKELRKKFFHETKKMDEKLKHFDTVLQRLEKKSGVPKVAYITFNECVGAQMAVYLFRTTLFETTFFHPNLFMKGYRLHVRQAPEPSTIIWENLPIPRNSRFLRKFVGTFVSLALVVVSLVAAYSVKVLQAKYSSDDTTCPNNFFSLTEDEKIAAVESNADILHCYCDHLDPVTVSSSSVCRVYHQHYVQTQVLSYFASLIVLLVNTLIEYVMYYFSDFEKHHSEDTKERSLFLRLFFLKYLNTSIIFLLCSDSTVLKGLATDQFKTTIFPESKWFVGVGNTVALVQLQDIFFVQSFTAFQYCVFYLKLRQARVNPLVALTQKDLNELHVGPPLPLSYRYSQVLAILFGCLTFNLGIPILNFFALVNFYMFYMTEKFCFIHFYRAPYRFSSQIGTTATIFIPIAVMVHLGVSIWILSIKSIFSTSDTANGYSFSQRVSYSQTRPLYDFLIALICCFGFYFLLKHTEIARHRITSWICGHYHTTHQLKKLSVKIADNMGFASRVNGGFLRAVQRNLIKDLASYNILKNPKYKEMFGISWNFVAKHIKISDLRMSNISLAHVDELELDVDNAIAGENIRRNRNSFDDQPLLQQQQQHSNFSSVADTSSTSNGRRPSVGLDYSLYTNPLGQPCSYTHHEAQHQHHGVEMTTPTRPSLVEPNRSPQQILYGGNGSNSRPGSRTGTPFRSRDSRTSQNSRPSLTIDTGGFGGFELQPTSSAPQSPARRGSTTGSGSGSGSNASRSSSPTRRGPPGSDVFTATATAVVVSSTPSRPSSAPNSPARNPAARRGSHSSSNGDGNANPNVGVATGNFIDNIWKEFYLPSENQNFWQNIITGEKTWTRPSS